MTEQEIEQLAKNGWQKLYPDYLQNEVPAAWWDHYIQGMKDAAKVLVQQGYPESALKSSWDDGYSKGHSQGLLYDMPERATHGTYEDWLKQYNATQQKEQ